MSKASSKKPTDFEALSNIWSTIKPVLTFFGELSLMYLNALEEVSLYSLTPTFNQLRICRQFITSAG
jgi:hypothetical protein